MKYTEVHKSVRESKLVFGEDRKSALQSFITNEVEDAIAMSQQRHALWRLLLRMYDGVPKNPVKSFPVENAPNIEVTLGAIASDAIYAQAYDAIFSIEPLVTVRGIPKKKGDKDYADMVKALQRFVNHISKNEIEAKTAIDEAILDNVQLGTGIYYIPWVERIKKTKVGKVLSANPIIKCHPPEDTFISGGSSDDPDDAILVALRFWRTAEQVEQIAKRNNWNTLGIAPAGAKDAVNALREMLGKQSTGVERKGNLYEIFDIYCYFDIDGDGLNEDLYIVWDRTSRTIVHVGYAPYDKRPIEKMVYQRRPHLFYGLGVLEMIMPYEDELTDIHNYATLNILLANTRIWKGRAGGLPSNMSLWPNRVVELSNPKEDLMPEQMGEVYPSIWNAQSMVVSLSERRVGLNEMSAPQGQGNMGTRTPGITALTMLQQTNKRFTPAFGGMQDATGKAVIQCLYRYKEKLMAGRGKEKVMAHITEVLGIEDGHRVITLLRNDKLEENVIVELTAGSATANKEAERQATFQLVSILAQYYQRTLELVQIAATPGTPEAVVEVAKRIATAASEIIERTLSTFDQIRDPDLFVIEVEEAIDQAVQEQPQQAVMGLLGMLGGEGGGNGARPNAGIMQPANNTQ